MFDKKFIYETDKLWYFSDSESIYERTFDTEIEKIRKQILLESPHRKGGVIIETLPAYIAIGRKLLEFIEIDEKILQMGEAVHKFYVLGKHVMHLQLKYKDAGLIQEEPCWLGLDTGVKKDTGWCLRFEPCKYLSDYDWINECSLEELGVLYYQYLRGKRDYITDRFGLNNAKEPIV